jgi:creatinine amidohydrolase
VADSSFGAHIFNTAMVYKGEPQSYHGKPPGLTTRLLLRLAPEHVDMGQARNFVSRWQGASNSAPRVAPDGGAPLAWQAQDLNPAGAVGDASSASAALGEEILAFAAERMSELWQQVAAFDVEAWLANEPTADA